MSLQKSRAERVAAHPQLPLLEPAVEAAQRVHLHPLLLLQVLVYRV